MGTPRWPWRRRVQASYPKILSIRQQRVCWHCKRSCRYPAHIVSLSNHLSMCNKYHPRPCCLLKGSESCNGGGVDNDAATAFGQVQQRKFCALKNHAMFRYKVMYLHWSKIHLPLTTPPRLTLKICMSASSVVRRHCWEMMHTLCASDYRSLPSIGVKGPLAPSAVPALRIAI